MEASHIGDGNDTSGISCHESFFWEYLDISSLGYGTVAQVITSVVRILWIPNPDSKSGTVYVQMTMSTPESTCGESQM